MKNTYFIEKLEQCCAAKGMKRTTFCKDFGISEATVRTWIRQGNYPQADVLYRIAKYFGVPLEYLIAGEENPIDDATAAFIVQTQGLTEDQKKVIYASIKAQVDMFKQMNKEKK